jgi:hypothetical protein
MASFKIVWEIELSAESPLEAAKEAQRWLRANDWQYYVQDGTSKEIFSVDLSEEEEEAIIPVEKYEPIIEQ